ncbi:MAG: cyclic-di-AMP receptor [Chloroflexota bacterium]
MSKLLVAIVHELDADKVITALEVDGHRVTQLRSSGGYLRTDNSTLVLGVEDAVAAVLAILERECSSRDIELPPVVVGRLEDLPAMVRHGGATVFLADLEAILRI